MYHVVCDLLYALFKDSDQNANAMLALTHKPYEHGNMLSIMIHMKHLPSVPLTVALSRPNGKQSIYHALLLHFFIAVVC